MLLRHSALYLLARGLPGLVNFLAIAIYTRLLAPEEYGRYALVIAGVGLFNVVFYNGPQKVDTKTGCRKLHLKPWDRFGSTTHQVRRCGAGIGYITSVHACWL